MKGKLVGDALNKSYDRYVNQYEKYQKNGTMNSEMMTKEEYADAHYAARLTGDSNLNKNIPRNLASAQRVVTQYEARYYSELLGESMKTIKTTDWRERYHLMFPNEDMYMTTSKGTRYMMTQAQALYFILKEAGFSDEEIYNE